MTTGRINQVAIPQFSSTAGSSEIRVCLFFPLSSTSLWSALESTRPKVVRPRRSNHGRPPGRDVTLAGSFRRPPPRERAALGSFSRPPGRRRVVPGCFPRPPGRCRIVLGSFSLQPDRPSSGKGRSWPYFPKTDRLSKGKNRGLLLNRRSQR